MRAPPARRSQPFFVPLLLLLSAVKFALVAMFYMHLKQDHQAVHRGVRLPPDHRDGDHPGADRARGVPLRVRQVRLTLLSLAPLLDERPRPTIPYELSWGLHPSVLLGTGLLGALYFYGIGPWRRRQGLPPAPRWKVASFVASLLVLLGSLNGPVHDLSDYYLFSVHMVQHLLLTLLFPPLLILGPAGLAGRAAAPPAGGAPRGPGADPSGGGRRSSSP